MSQVLRSIAFNKAGRSEGITYLTEPDPDGTTGIVTPITITSGTPAWTSGAYAEIEDVTSEDRWITHVMLYDGNDPATTEFEVDVAIGAAGDENVVATVAGFEQVDKQQYLITLTVPIFVPSGSRIAARSRTSVATKTINIVLFCALGLAGI